MFFSYNILIEVILSHFLYWIVTYLLM